MLEYHHHHFFQKYKNLKEWKERVRGEEISISLLLIFVEFSAQESRGEEDVNESLVF